MVDIKIAPYYTNRIIPACFMFLCGYVYKRMNLNTGNWMCIIIGYAICIITVCFTPFLDMWIKGFMFIPFAVTAIAGTLATFSLSIIINHYQSGVKQHLIAIGNQTLIILTFHFLAFKLVTWIMISFFDYNTTLAIFPIIKAPNTLWWIAYTLAGVSLPMILLYLSKKTKKIF